MFKIFNKLFTIPYKMPRALSTRQTATKAVIGSKRKLPHTPAGVKEEGEADIKTRAKASDYHDILLRLLNTLEKNANPAVAPGMEAYMRNQFKFYGLQKPVRSELCKGYLDDLLALSLGITDVDKVVRFLWEQPKRECIYFALDYVAELPQMSLYKEGDAAAALSLLEYMLITKSWWDSVDVIASKLVGRLFELCPSLVEQAIEKWDGTSNIWLHRTSIIYQLKYKSKTNERILFTQCEKYMHSEEFFLRKSIGWALREYAKTRPSEVKGFLKRNESKMSGLSIREAKKHL